jgi:diketogulonate reductase-like aldo/keto reductase
VLAQEGVVAIPKASDPDHVKANRAAADLDLTPEDLAALNKAFPPPKGPRPLEML